MTRVARFVCRLLHRNPGTGAAAELFRRDLAGLADEFLQAARAAGKPRGLVWVAAEANGEPRFVRDGRTGGLVALLPLVVQFEPVTGSDLEEVPQSREPRPVTALFTYAGGAWRTDGRAVFNLSPGQVTERSGGRFV